MIDKKLLKDLKEEIESYLKDADKLEGLAWDDLLDKYENDYYFQLGIDIGKLLLLTGLENKLK